MQKKRLRKNLSCEKMSDRVLCQGRRQDFAKGEADAKSEMPTPLGLGVVESPGVWGLLAAHDHMFLE